MDKEKAVQLLDKYKHLFIKAYIFGSIAQDTQDEWSDLDVVLVRHTNLPFPERSKEVLPLIIEAKGADALIYTPEEFSTQMGKNGFVKEIIRGSIVVEGEQEGSIPMVETGGK